MPPLSIIAAITIPTRRKRTVLTMGGTAPIARGQDREQEIHAGQDPQSTPVAGCFTKRCARLVEMNEAIDAEFGRKERSSGKHAGRDRFLRPRESHEEERRN